MPQLAYADRWLRQEGSQVSLIPCPPQPDDGRDFYVLRLSGSELTDILSALTTGAELINPENTEQLLLNAMWGETCPMALCTFIQENCLTDPDFVQALINALADAGALQLTGGSDVPQSETLDMVLIDLGAGCDDDDRFGAAYKVVELLDAVFTDLLELLAIFSTNIEIAQELAKKIPIIGQYTATPLQVAKFMVDIAIESYLAAFDTNSHDDLACAIFCRMGASCQLTLQMVIDGYSDIVRVEIDIPPLPSTWLTVAQFLFDISEIFSDNVIAGVCHWIILQVFARGSAFNANTTRILQIALSAASSIPPPEGGCDCNWYHDWINENDDGSEFFTFFPVGTSGTPSYNSGNTRIEGVYHPTSVPTASNYILMRFDGSGLPFTLLRMKFYLQVSNQRSATDGFYLADNTDPTYPPDATAIYSVDLANGQTIVDTGALASGDGVVVDDGLALYAFVAQTDDAQTFWIYRIEIWGRGTDPFAP